MQTPSQCSAEQTPSAPLVGRDQEEDDCFTDSDDPDVDRYDTELQFSFLQRVWLSKRFGYIHVLQDPTNPFQLNVLQPSFRVDLATIVWSCDNAWELTALDMDKPGQERWKFNGWQGTKKRVLWTECSTGAHEIWDRRLLAAIGRAANWPDQRTLVSHFGFGLRRLSMNETTGSEVSVGLCTSTRNRLWQLKRALPLNILHVWPHRRWTKLRVVVCSSTDSTLRFLVEQCRFAIDIGLLEVYTTEDRMPYWHASIAKNTAHMVSKEDIVVNVDDDNLVGPDFPVDVVRHMLQGYTVISYEPGDGTCGRIACPREDFCRIKGYDEDCMPLGGQDFDLLKRLTQLPGAWSRSYKGSVCAIAVPNTQEQSVVARDLCDPRYSDLKWTQMDAFNKKLLFFRRSVGQTTRNTYKRQIGVPVVKAILKKDVPRSRLTTRPTTEPNRSTSRTASVRILDREPSSAQAVSSRSQEQANGPGHSESTQHAGQCGRDQQGVQPQSLQEELGAQSELAQEQTDQPGRQELDAVTQGQDENGSHGHCQYCGMDGHVLSECTIKAAERKGKGIGGRHESKHNRRWEHDGRQSGSQEPSRSSRECRNRESVEGQGPASEQRLEARSVPTAAELNGTWIGVDPPRGQYVIENQLVTCVSPVRRHFSIQWNRDKQCWQWGPSGWYHMQWLSKDELVWMPHSSWKEGRPWRWQRWATPARPNSPGSRAETQTHEGTRNVRIVEPTAWQDPAYEVGQHMVSQDENHASERNAELQSQVASEGVGNDRPGEQADGQEQVCERATEIPIVSTLASNACSPRGQTSMMA